MSEHPIWALLLHSGVDEDVVALLRGIACEYEIEHALVSVWMAGMDKGELAGRCFESMGIDRDLTAAPRPAPRRPPAAPS